MASPDEIKALIDQSVEDALTKERRRGIVCARCGDRLGHMRPYDDGKSIMISPCHRCMEKAIEPAKRLAQALDDIQSIEL